MTVTQLDRVFHERGRLAICSELVAHEEPLTFTQLQDRCDLTDGNLNRHLHALVEENIVRTERRTGNGRPQTLVRITPTGRQRFLAYIDALERIVRDVQKSAKPAARTIPTSS